MNEQRTKRTKLRGVEPQRDGAINVLVAFMMVGFLAFAAMCIDVGHLLNAREELQRSCDAAAMAACWEIAERTANSEPLSTAMPAAQVVAANYAGFNDVTNDSPNVTYSANNNGDVVFGYVSDVNDPDTFTTNANDYNAVRVRIRRNSAINGDVSFFLGPIFGRQGQATESSATAMLLSSVRGFQSPSGGGTVDILPFALDVETWNDYKDYGAGDDLWTYDASTRTVSAGGDGKREINLYPQDTGSPGNRGTVDIGGANNSTSDLSRQIVNGISEQDFDDLGQPLEFDSSGELELNGDTGISAGIKDDLAAIIGQKRAIPVFSNVAGPGNNAQYTIIKWVGIRVMEAKLTGKKSGKRVLVQEAPLTMRGIRPGTSSSYSSSIFSPVFLLN